jgi:hypothetical protein
MVHLFHSFEARPERAPEHVPPVFAISDCVEAKVELRLDNVFDVGVFNLAKVRSVRFARLPSMASVQELVGTKKGTEVLCAEGGVSVES